MLSLLNKNDNTNYNSNYEWLRDKLIVKLVKWSEQDDECNDSFENDADKSVSQLKSSSLKLISISEYCIRYQKLKKIYGKKFVEVIYFLNIK